MTRVEERDDLLAHDVRNRIYQTIEDDPGIYIAEIADKVNAGWGTAVYHLGVLEEEGLVVSKRDGRYKRYFENGGQYEEKEVLAAIRNKTTRDVVDAILEHPGITQSGICDALGISAPLVHWHLDKLREADAVRQERDGRYKRHWPKETLQDVADHVLEAKA